MSKLARQQARSNPADWPDLPFADWADTCTTLHLWTQIVGKNRLAYAPMVNHWWQSPLDVTSRGLTTSPIHYGGTSFQIDTRTAEAIFLALTDKGCAGVTMAMAGTPYV